MKEELRTITTCTSTEEEQEEQKEDQRGEEAHWGRTLKEEGE